MKLFDRFMCGLRKWLKDANYDTQYNKISREDFPNYSNQEWQQCINHFKSIGVLEPHGSSYTLNRDMLDEDIDCGDV